MDQGTELIRLAVFGQPVTSSLSPSIHRMFAQQLGLEIDYRRIETGPDGFPGALEAFQASGGAGCNVTLPLKGDAWRLAAKSSSQAARAQAANTLVRRPSGWFAHNTDGAGLLADLNANNRIYPNGRRIMVLGAGGATAGILGVLLACKPEQVVLVNRRLDRVRVLSDRFNSPANLTIASWTDLSLQGSFDLVINATSLGHQGKAPPLISSAFAPGAVCYDLNYYKASQPLKALCAVMGQRYVDGLGMLVEQAANSFEIWTGERPDCTVVIEKLRSENH